MKRGGPKLQLLELLIGQIAARILAMGVFVFIVLTVLGWWNKRPIKHYPRHHICGICRVPWYEGHECAPPVVGSAPQVLITHPRKDIARRDP